MKTYTDTFGQWVEFTDKVAPPVAVIEFNVKNMIPVAGETIASAKVYTNAASTRFCLPPPSSPPAMAPCCRLNIQT